MKEKRTAPIGPRHPDFKVRWEDFEGAEKCRNAETPGHLTVGTRPYAAWKGIISLPGGEKRKIFLCNECRFRLGKPPNVKWTDLNIHIVSATESSTTEAKKRKKKTS